MQFLYVDDMRYNDNILERIGEFYADLECGKWTDYLSKKPEGFDNMEDNEKMHHAFTMMIKINDLMEDPWEVIRTWARRLTLENPPFDAFDMFMDYELDRLKRLEQTQNHENKKTHFWNRLCK